MLIYEGGHNEDPEFHMDDIYMKTLETIVIPIMVGKDLAAIVQYQGKRNQRGRKKGFSTEDETLILCVTNMAAIAFERLLNKQKARQNLAYFEAVCEIISHLTAARS